MEFQIAQVSPGVGPNDLLFAINYWYDDFGRGKGKKPDFTEHHVFINYNVDPSPRTDPVQNKLGQYVLTDGTVLPEWVESEEGEWERRDPREVLASYDVETVEVEPMPIDERLLAAVETHALRVLVEHPTGIDLYSVTDYIGNVDGDHFAHRPEVQGLKGKARRVN